MNKLKKTILALTFLRRVKKNHTPISTNREIILDDPHEAKTMEQSLKKYNQITTSERTTSIEEKNDQNYMFNFPTIKTNKIVPVDLQNEEPQGMLSLENFEKEVSLTENDSRYFRSESDVDESPNFDDKEKVGDPSLFCIEEVDELENKNEEKNNITRSKILTKNDQAKILQQPQLPQNEEKMQENRSMQNIEEENSGEIEILNQEEFNVKIITNIRAEERFRNDQFVIYPDDSFKKMWNLLMSSLIMYVCLVMPYRVCFMEDDSEFKNLDYFTDSCFYLDIIVNFFSVYHDIEDDLVVSNRKIAMHYLATWFFFDFISIFPFDAIILNGKYNTLVRVARLPKLYRLVRVAKLIRMIKLLKEKRKILNPLLKMGAGSQRLIFSIISIIIFCHIACCFWYLTGIMDDTLDNWVDNNGYTDSGNFECYIASFYWVTSTVVTVGYGDIVASNTTERVMSCFLMFVGVVFYSFTIGSLSSLLSEFDAKNSVFDKKLNTLIQIKKKYAFDETLYLRIKKALKYGELKTDRDKEKFLTELPSNLRTELSFFMHKSIVSSIEFFKNRSERFIAFIGPLLKPIKIGRSEIIASQGDYANEMFFIKHGKVAIVIRQYNNFKFMNISEGYYFGEVDLLFGETRKFTFVADTDLELLSINKKQFTKIFFHEFISIGNELYKNALKRRVRMNKLYRDALEYCKTRHQQEKSRKISKGSYSHLPESFIIDEERYSRKISFTNEEMQVFEKLDSITETKNRDKELFENYEEEYVKSFKTSKTLKDTAQIKKIVEKPKKSISDFNAMLESKINNDSSKDIHKGPNKLKNIINGLIQNKRTLKDEVDDLMVSKKQKNEDENQEFQNYMDGIQKKVSNLNDNFLYLLNRLKNNKEKKFAVNSLNKIETILKEEKSHKKTCFADYSPKKLSNEISHIKKAVSIKLSNPITTLDKILENEKLINGSKPKRRSIDKSIMKSMTKILPKTLTKISNESLLIENEIIPINRTRSKSFKK